MIIGQLISLPTRKRERRLLVSQFQKPKGTLKEEEHPLTNPFIVPATTKKKWLHILNFAISIDRQNTDTRISLRQTVLWVISFLKTTFNHLKYKRGSVLWRVGRGTILNVKLTIKKPNFYNLKENVPYKEIVT